MGFLCWIDHIVWFKYLYIKQRQISFNEHRVNIAINDLELSEPKSYPRIIGSNKFTPYLNDLNLNSLLVKRQIDNPSPGVVTEGN